MGQYKVPQNVEAEDKILGPLTFRQFIYALIGVGWGLICFALFNKVIVVMLILALPPVLLFELLAFYSRDGQNFEQVLIAMVGFFASPHKRLWVKESDVAESFHIEPTKHAIEASQRNPVEVRSELEKLASLIDSLSSHTVRARIWRGITQEGAVERTLQEHHAILDAIAAGDADLASALTVVHVSGVEQWLRSAL